MPFPPTSEHLITATSYAQRYGMVDWVVVMRVRRGHLKGGKIGRVWYVEDVAPPVPMPRRPRPADTPRWPTITGVEEANEGAGSGGGDAVLAERLKGQPFWKRLQIVLPLMIGPLVGLWSRSDSPTDFVAHIVVYSVVGGLFTWVLFLITELGRPSDPNT